MVFIEGSVSEGARAKSWQKHDQESEVLQNTGGQVKLLFKEKKLFQLHLMMDMTIVILENEISVGWN